MSLAAFLLLQSLVNLPSSPQLSRAVEAVNGLGQSLAGARTVALCGSDGSSCTEPSSFAVNYNTGAPCALQVTLTAPQNVTRTIILEGSSRSVTSGSWGPQQSLDIALGPDAPSRILRFRFGNGMRVGHGLEMLEEAQQQCEALARSAR